MGIWELWEIDKILRSNLVHTLFMLRFMSLSETKQNGSSLKSLTSNISKNVNFKNVQGQFFFNDKQRNVITFSVATTL